MALMQCIVEALLPLAHDTTLCEGEITIILDQGCAGPYIIVGYAASNGMDDGD